MIQKNKFDENSPSSQFSVSGFKSYRKYISGNAGGLLMYVRGDLPQHRRLDLEPSSKETLSRLVEINKVY